MAFSQAQFQILLAHWEWWRNRGEEAYKGCSVHVFRRGTGFWMLPLKGYGCDDAFWRDATHQDFLSDTTHQSILSE